MISKAVPLFKNLRLTVRRPGKANDAAELLAALPQVQQRAAKAFPHSENAIEDFQPNLNFARAYTPDIFNGFAKLGQVTGFYDANGHYARISFADLNIFNYTGGELEPIPPSRQFETLGSGETVKRRCPGAATQRRLRRLQPLRRTAVHRLRRHLLPVQPLRPATRPMKKSNRKKGLIALALVAADSRGLPARLRRQGDDEYIVRAIFDNGSFMVSGEQVRVAGANVGEIEKPSTSPFPDEVDSYEDGRRRGDPRQGRDRR